MAIDYLLFIYAIYRYIDMIFTPDIAIFLFSLYTLHFFIISMLLFFFLRHTDIFFYAIFAIRYFF